MPPDLTKRKSGVAAGQARVEEFKRKEREARARRPRLRHRRASSPSSSFSSLVAACQRGGGRVDGVGGSQKRSRRPQAKLKADEDARKAAEAQTRAENGDDNDKKEESSDDEEPEARRRLERRGRGLGRADAAQRWRDLEAKADALCQRAQRHAPSVTRSRNRLELDVVAAMASTRCHAASTPSTWPSESLRVS